MGLSEPERHDLYNGLSEFLGPERAEALMSTLPTFDYSELATKADLERFASAADFERFATKQDLERFATKQDLERFATKADFELLSQRMDRIEDRLLALEARMDRLFYLVLIAMLGMVGAVTTLAVNL